MMSIKELLQKAKYSKEYNPTFDTIHISDQKFHSKENLLEITIELEKTLPINIYFELILLLEKVIPCELDVTINADKCDLQIIDINEYFKHYLNEYSLSIFDECLLTLQNDQIICLCPNDNIKDTIQEKDEEMTTFLKKCGVNYPISYSVKKIEVVEKTVVIEQRIEPTSPKVVVNKDFRREKKKHLNEYQKMEISELSDEMSQIRFVGTVFENKIIRTKYDKLIQTLLVHDGPSAVNVKRFESRITSKEQIEEVQIGDTYNFYGKMEYDTYSNDFVFNAEFLENTTIETIKDEAENKRVELHLHTNMSEMDGVCDVEELVKQAYNFGHRAVAITDHSVVQAFPKAQSAWASCLKKGDNKDFKVLYGCEMNMVDEDLVISVNPTDELLDSATYVMFDLETTGLSSKYDHIIEFGAVKMKNGEMIGKMQMFIKPPVQISSFTTSLTKITNSMLQNEKTIEECLPKILDFIADGVLVAHNAEFDLGFLNEVLVRNNMEKLKNTCIDTLNLARCIHKDRRYYRLGNIARQYRVPYDENTAHRADYDASILADVFMLMVQDCKKLDVFRINELVNLRQDDSFIKAMKKHIVVMAKNQAGLKRLFELITISHTKTLALFGKANSKSNGEEFMAEPRILRSELKNNREDLLYGTACFHGEIFELAANRSQEELEEALMFYDYVEIQPLENYRPLIDKNNVPNEERIKMILKNIVDTARKLNKIVVATGDVHYNNPNQKILRDIYISAQGIGGIRHPLYINDKDSYSKPDNPDQHFRVTNEMLDSFKWLGEDLAYELVVTNSNMIADMCEVIKPIHDKLYTPRIEGVDEKLSELCYENAKAIYGENLPEIVSKRLDRELNSIISNGFSVVYYVSHLLVKKSNEDGYLVGSRGSVGSSFVATTSNITEVNPLAPHYICKKCHHHEFITDGSVASGYDLEDKVCPNCGEVMRGDGQDIPFETFLGFEGDKVPDIDLNFSGDYQMVAHAYTKEVFGDDYVYRAGTIGTVAKKTAYGYVSGYCEDMNIENMRQAQKEVLAFGCEGVKRTTGQHPGGIIVIPDYMEVHDFTPVNYPANNPLSEWKTTHFDFHAIHDNVLKFDILGHVDPTVMRMLQNISGIDPRLIPMNDKDTMSLFSSSYALKADPKLYSEKTGAAGLPEFGTKFVRGILELTKPQRFSDLVIISGLSHGTDVWLNNAKDLVERNIPLQQVIGCRDDIMVYLIHRGLKPKDAFNIMESVRKGRGLTAEWEEIMRPVVDEWYIESCKKIKYMFPKAHAVAYVIMAVRIAWFKVYYPHYYYAVFFTLRCDAYEIDTMINGYDAIVSRIENIEKRLYDPNLKREVSTKEELLLTTLEVCKEMYARGYKFSKIDLELSLETEFSVSKDDPKTLIPPFSVVDGLGENVAKSIVEARKEHSFISKEDLLNRTQLSNTLVEKLRVLGCLDKLQDENQMSLF